MSRVGCQAGSCVCSSPAEAGLACVDVVPAEPADTFPERCAAAVAAAAAAGRHYTAVYVSQVTYLSQRCLLRSIPDFVGRIRAAAAASCAAGAKVLTGTAVGGADSSQAAPLVIIDGYHSFCALPIRLGAAIQSCCLVGGLLKHAGCGANCAFLVTPPGLVLRPVFTGWLADPSVLAPGSCGIGVGSEVSALAASGPPFQDCWRRCVRVQVCRHRETSIGPGLLGWACADPFSAPRTRTPHPAIRSATFLSWRCRAEPLPTWCPCSPSTTSCRCVCAAARGG